MVADQVIIVGAGMGGLACAIELAAAGAQVTVVERTSRPGGKMREVRVGDARIDTGPTVLTMPWVFEHLFQRAGARLQDHVHLQKAGILARHAWADGTRFDLHADRTRSAEAIGTLSGAASQRGYLAFCDHAQQIYETLKDTFLTQPANGPMGLSQRIGLGRMDRLMALRPFDTLWEALGPYFPDPRLRQLFGRYATYCGSSPYLAPATLMLIAHVEQAGVYMVAGGMQRLADAMETVARDCGVTFLYGHGAERLLMRHGRASGVVLDDGRSLEAGAVVINADPASLLAARDRRAEAASGARSLSAVTWAMTARTSGLPLVRHNVFFSDDYAAEFDALFVRGAIPEKPTVYVCAQDRDESGTAPAGAERLLLLINAPANGDTKPLTPKEIRACEARVTKLLASCGLDVTPDQEPAVVTTPWHFNGLFPGTGGALYGRATHGWSAAFQRPQARTSMPGLYQAGGGAHPGAGVPMATLSGQLAARKLISDRGSMRRFRPGATVGGTSTP
jgi:1-hydroxycarotenoid 3,4-desaturase